MANVVIFSGRLTRDPDIRYTKGENSMCIARFTIAVDRRGKDKVTDFPNMIAFGKTGEFCERYLKKGTKIITRCHYVSSSYTNKDGQKVYTHEFAIDDIEFAESKAVAAQNAEQASPQETTTQQTTQQSAPKETIDNFVDIPDGLDDGLPFA